MYASSLQRYFTVDYFEGTGRFTRKATTQCYYAGDQYERALADVVEYNAAHNGNSAELTTHYSIESP